MTCLRSYVTRRRTHPCTAVEWERSPVARAPHRGRFLWDRSLASFQLPLSPIRLLAVGIEYLDIVSV
jgi:hypothetical protein